MKPEQWKAIEAIYYQAQQCDRQARAAFLDAACAGDDELRRQVESLLQADADAASFLDTPAMNLAAQMVADNQMTSLIGKRLSRYEIVQQIGAGGMGEVYRARDIRLNRDVAIKVLPAHLAQDRDALTRFEREARAVAALSHPNILAIHDFGDEQGVCYAVTELLTGESLRERLSRSAFDWREGVEIGAAIAEGLSAAHAKGIIHRDLKPENIFLLREGGVKILDFGLARMTVTSLKSGDATAAVETSMTEPGAVVGTVGYMSPEQVRGEKVEAASDIFSFGCVLYEMVTGRRAFAGETTVERLAAILRDEPVQLSAEQGPEELQQVISRCLKKRAEARYESARELTPDLKALLSGAEISLPASTHRLRKVQPALWIAAALLVVCAGAVAYWQIGSHQSAGQFQGSQITEQAIDSIAVLPLVNASGDADTEYLSDGLTEDVINSLSHLSKLRVIARTTVFRYKGRDLDPIKVGSQLNVRAVLTGRVFLHGDTLSVQADLLDVVSGEQLWGKKFNKKLTDIFTVQEQIAQQITDGLRLKLPNAEQQQLTKHYTENIESYQLYLKGRREAYKFNQEGMEKAPSYFHQAIQLDPNYALAYAGLAEYHMIYYGSVQSGALSKEAAMKALAMDETLAEAHSALATVSAVYEWNWSEAEREYQRAIALSPGSASAHSQYGLHLAQLGRMDEAVAELKLAQQLDPLSPSIYTNLGRAFYNGRRYDQAIEQLLKALELEPNFYLARLFLGRAYEQQDRFDQALAELQKAISPLRLRFGSGGRPWFARTLALAGRKSEARKLLARLQPSERYSLPMAALYTSLGDKDQAFIWLEKAFDERYGTLYAIKVDPVFDPLRSDPRMDNLLRRMGLAP